MKNILRYSFVALLAMVCSMAKAQTTVTFDWSGVTVTQQQEQFPDHKNVYTQGDVTATFTSGTNSYNNCPLENKAGELRMYVDTDVTFAVAGGKKIGRIVFTATGSSYGADKLTYNGTAISNTWTLSEPAQEVKLIASANARFEKIEITLLAAGETLPDAPNNPTVSIANTPETAYTVAKALELYAAGQDLSTKVYIKGYITEISEVSTSYGNASYYISDVKGDKTNQYYVFHGYYLDGEKFTSADQIGINDEVIVYGEMSAYKGSPQIAQGSKIHSIKKGDSGPTVDISNTPETAYTVAKAKELIAAGEGLLTQVYVKGYVTEITEVSLDYGNANYYINDTKGSKDGQLQVYRGYYLENAKFTEEEQLNLGDEVILFGTLKDYNGTQEITNSYIHSLNGKTTGINAVKVDNDWNSKVIYNLAGQRVTTPKKGLYIINGKKVVIK